jgi:hypothetical protein
MLRNRVVPELLAQYRQKAEACRRLAELCEDDRRRTMWIERATAWEQLAMKTTKQPQNVKAG